MVRYIVIICLIIIMSAETSLSDPVSIPYSTITTPVVHAGRYHVLQAGGTYLILDEREGMTIRTIGLAKSPGEINDPSNAVLENVSLGASIISNGETLEIGQVYDASPHLKIIAQGPDYVAARVFFRMCSPDGFPRGDGSLDIYVYRGRLHLAPRLLIEYETGGVIVKEAGFYYDVPGDNTRMKVNETAVNPRGLTHFAPFGEDNDDFTVLIEATGRPTARIGWLRNSWPEWLYLHAIFNNPETDELYEKWPPYVTQGANVMSWNLSWTPMESSGLVANYSEQSLKNLSFLWINEETIELDAGGHASCGGLLMLSIGESSSEANEYWFAHAHPIKPEVRSGDFRYYNEIEGVYEIDSQGDDVDVTFDCSHDKHDRKIFVRIWNLKGKGACEVKVNSKSVPFGLLNDGDLIEDPLAFIVQGVRVATGPACFATVSFTAKKGEKTRLTMTRTPGIQLTYQMYSQWETYEAWSDVCTDKPLFKLYLTKALLHELTLPGRAKYAMFLYNLYGDRSPSQTRSMNEIRGFTVYENGPQCLKFIYQSVDLMGTALNSYTVTVPYQKDRITLDVELGFDPVGNGAKWSTFELCDVFPFGTVYRRDFHFDDFIFQREDGVFDRVGTGAWGANIELIKEPERLGYYSVWRRRATGPGSRVPGSRDCNVWIFGNNPERGNILFRRGDWAFNSGIATFGICNAWVDINNFLVRRKEPSKSERITYTLEIFGGPVPSLDKLNAMYQKAADGQKVKRVTGIAYTEDGSIGGFITE